MPLPTKNKDIIIPSDYYDYIYRFTYYCLSRVAPHIPRKITPNQITVLGFISAMIGTALLYFVQTPAAYLYWVLFNFIWFLLDALDGMHARLSQQSSEFGAFLDHALDNIYFVFMLTVFAAKFDLVHLIYIYIIILRVTGAVMVFTVQCHTKKLYLSRVSGGFETLLFSIVMMLTYFFPHFNPAMHTTSPFLLHWINQLSLQQGMFMKLNLFVYFFGIPVTTWLQFRFVKKAVCASDRIAP